MTPSPTPDLTELERLLDLRARIFDGISGAQERALFDALPSLITAARERDELKAENNELRRKALPVGGTDSGERRAAASKLLCDICACAAEAEPESMALPHVVESCILPLETLIYERDASLYLLQQAHKVHGRDVIDAIVEKARAERERDEALRRVEEVEREKELLHPEPERTEELVREAYAYLSTVAADEQGHMPPPALLVQSLQSRLIRITRRSHPNPEDKS